ncbi:MAG: exodeoxyribonuclease VII small subunit [Candidatus Cloacimonadales bacterium]|jgi:exodeoxyribonuclease VII small subunit|nr:exodeoxyribonuclease VII small subunit [Candidatus Cloacimonadota bacterium]MDD2650088.1 exodeoxyribonuclease VII small subunit [Candidatus Cloacimonadota bacterium]MDD3501092.1 exodeoxyribonuclease VII small subunit [Candidatus Cloacimonadota bacterium]MDX9976739.1 exodeoxyribonuclease VII small subunit [Candidatus Cloacimonadales bacterium]
MKEDNVLTFEESVKKLDTIIKSLEGNTIEHLEEMILKYEEGSELLLNCYDFLENAEMRVEVISKNLNMKKREKDEN